MCRHELADGECRYRPNALRAHEKRPSSDDEGLLLCRAGKTLEKQQ
jgi:hypothetical protein